MKKGENIVEDPIKQSIHFRANQETIKKLEIVAKKTRKSKSEVIRNGIDIQYQRIERSEHGENHTITGKDMLKSDTGNQDIK